MIHIRYSAPNELELSGTFSELQKIRQGLLALSAGNIAAMAEPADYNIDPQPYAVALASFRARTTQGQIKVAITGNEVVVDGAAETFKGFASFFDFPQDAAESSHKHHEYFEGNAYVHRESIPLVIGMN